MLRKTPYLKIVLAKKNGALALGIVCMLVIGRRSYKGCRRAPTRGRRRQRREPRSAFRFESIVS
jgi:hypothetical protein